MHIPNVSNELPNDTSNRNEEPSSQRPSTTTTRRPAGTTTRHPAATTTRRSTTTTTTKTRRPSCIESITIVNGQQKCKNTLLFDENFDNNFHQRWSHDVAFPSATGVSNIIDNYNCWGKNKLLPNNFLYSSQDIEFVVYYSDPSLYKMENGQLHITPQIFPDINETKINIPDNL